jgi:hypothetical protein
VILLPKKMQLELINRISYLCQQPTRQPGMTHLEHPGKGEDKSARGTDEEDGRHVQPERHSCIGDHDDRSDSHEFAERRKALGERQETGVDDRANLSKDCERIKGPFEKEVRTGA